VPTFIEVGADAILLCADLPSLPLDSVAGVRAMVLDSVGPIRHAVNVPFHDSQARGKAILIRTGWDRRLGTPDYDQPGPYLHEELIFRLIRARVRIVGVDFPGANAEELIAKDIPVVERLSNLESLPRWGGRFFAVPPQITGRSSTVRAFVEINGESDA